MDNKKKILIIISVVILVIIVAAIVLISMNTKKAGKPVPNTANDNRVVGPSMPAKNTSSPPTSTASAASGQSGIVVVNKNSPVPVQRPAAPATTTAPVPATTTSGVAQKVNSTPPLKTSSGQTIIYPTSSTPKGNYLLYSWAYDAYLNVNTGGTFTFGRDITKAVPIFWDPNAADGVNWFVLMFPNSTTPLVSGCANRTETRLQAYPENDVYGNLTLGTTINLYGYQGIIFPVQDLGKGAGLQLAPCQTPNSKAAIDSSYYFAFVTPV